MSSLVFVKFISSAHFVDFFESFPLRDEEVDSLSHFVPSDRRVSILLRGTVTPILRFVKSSTKNLLNPCLRSSNAHEYRHSLMKQVNPPPTPLKPTDSNSSINYYSVQSHIFSRKRCKSRSTYLPPSSFLFLILQVQNPPLLNPNQHLLIISHLQFRLRP